MKQFLLMLVAVSISSVSFAATQPSGLTNALSSAWKTQKAHPKLDSRDINMVYGGQDISRKPTLVVHTATA